MFRRRTLARTLSALGSGLWLAGCFVSINDYKDTSGRAHGGAGTGGVRDGGAGRGTGGASGASTDGGSGGGVGSGGAAGGASGATGGRDASSTDGAAGAGGGGTEAGATGGTTNAGGAGGTPGTGGTAEAGTDASSGGNGGAVGCGLLELPPPPPRPPITGLGQFSVALRSLNLGDGDIGCTTGPDLTVGMDLDQECNGSQRVFRAGACGGGTAEDGPGGIDNQLAGLLNALQCSGAGFEDYTSAKINGEIRNGDYTILLTVSRYNFSPSDDDVTVTLRMGGILPNPTFTSADSWPVGTLPGDPAPYEVVSAPKTAYVANGILVAKIDDLPLKMPLGTTAITTFDLHGAVLTCGIETPDGGDPTLTHCVLAGAWRVRDVFAQLGAADVAPGVPLCASEPNFEFSQDIVDSLCAAADLVVLPDRGCDAVSFGVSFETGPTHLGPVQTVNRVEVVCPSVPDCPIHDQ